MMRMAGRDSKGLAKGIKTTQEGNIVTEPKKTARQFIGEFKEPYDEGYVGNIAVSGLEIYEKIEVDADVRDAKIGKSGIFIANLMQVKKYDEHGSLLWTYSDFSGNHINMIRVDYNDDIIISGSNNMGYQITEKISGKTGNFIWRNINNSSNYILSYDMLVDNSGDVYLSGNARSDEPLTGQVKKHSGLDGSVIWTYIYTAKTPTFIWYIALDSSKYLYLSYRDGVIKIDQSVANQTTPPTTVWEYTAPNIDAFGEHIFINVDVDGFIYRVEHDYKWNAGHPSRDVHLVKLDQSEGEPVEVWSVIIPNQTNELITDRHSRPYLDETSNIYFSLKGKIDSSKNDFWNDVPPFTITDTRGNCLVGFNKVRGYNGDARYVVYKTGIDTVEYYQMGVK